MQHSHCDSVAAILFGPEAREQMNQCSLTQSCLVFSFVLLLVIITPQRINHPRARAQHMSLIDCVVMFSVYSVT